MGVRRYCASISVVLGCLFGGNVLSNGEFSKAYASPSVSIDQSARLAFSAAQKGDWDTVHRLTQGRPEDGLTYLLTWMELKDPKSTVTLNNVDRLLDVYTGWPEVSRIFETIEASCIRQMRSEQLVDWFLNHPPRTIEGEMAYSKALLDVGKNKEAWNAIKAVWYSASLSSGQEQRFLETFSTYLTESDMVHRLNEMLWLGNKEDARRMMNRVPSGVAYLADIRLKLLNKDKTAASLWNGLSQEQRQRPEMMHAYVFYLRKTDQDQHAIQVLNSIPLNMKKIHPEAWWEHQNALVRLALKTQGASTAYKIVSETGLYKGADFVEAQWLAGWIALRFINNPQQAYQHFSVLLPHVKMPISQSRAYYWLARSEEALGKTQQARLNYEKASTFSYTYYGQLAAEALNKKTASVSPSAAVVTNPTHPEDMIVSNFDNLPFDQLPMVQAIKAAHALGAEKEGRQLLFSFSKQATNPDHHKKLGNWASSANNPYLLVKLGKSALANGVFIPYNLYPYLEVFEPNARETGVELSLLKALSRQESEFSPTVVSPAGARGLMQLMPATASYMAKKVGWSSSNISQVTDNPTQNVKLGSLYLKQLIDRYDGSYVLALASYNAGSGRVDKWLGEYGDPRNKRTDVIDWVELIPFSETRNYVQRILESNIVYRALINKSPATMTLSTDLRRGG